MSANSTCPPNHMCDQVCHRDTANNGLQICSCFPGYHLDSDNTSCSGKLISQLHTFCYHLNDSFIQILMNVILTTVDAVRIVTIQLVVFLVPVMQILYWMMTKELATVAHHCALCAIIL